MAGRDEGRSSEQMERTVYVANLDSRVTDEILYELMVQAGPLDYVSRPKERPYAFVVFEHEESVPYAIALFRGVRLFDRALDMRPRDGTEQARKINAYMEEVQQSRRQAITNPRDNGRHSGGNFFTPPAHPTARFSSTMNSSGQVDVYNADSSRGYNNQRSTSWPKFLDAALGVPPGPSLVPPPSSAPFPFQSVDRSNRWERDDRRGDYDDPYYRDRGNGDDYSRRRSRSRERDDYSKGNNSRRFSRR